MKKWLCMILVWILAGSCCGALAESCKYSGQGSPCEPGWWVDRDKKQHARACFYHVEEKEDMNSHVLITDWENCSIGENGTCSVCGVSYSQSGNTDSDENNEKFLLEYFIMMGMEAGAAPVQASLSGNWLTLGFAGYFSKAMMEKGFLSSESLAADSKFTLTLPDGDCYAFAGEAVTPDAAVERTDYGAGVWLEEKGLITVGTPVYENNSAPGTAAVLVDISVKNGSTYTLKKTFTIEGTASTPGDANKDGKTDMLDALDLLQSLADWGNAVDENACDVNGDGTVNVQDLLSLLRMIAG